jgi:hypothetical protein
MIKDANICNVQNAKLNFVMSVFRYVKIKHGLVEEHLIIVGKLRKVKKLFDKSIWKILFIIYTLLSFVLFYTNFHKNKINYFVKLYIN